MKKMLVLTRKIDEKLVVNGNIEITVTRIGRERVSIGINAPDEISIRRAEVAASSPDRRRQILRSSATGKN